MPHTQHNGSPLYKVIDKQILKNFFVSVIICSHLLISCNLQNTPEPTATISPTFTSTPSPTQLSTPESTQVPYEEDTGWELLNTGLERRIINSYNSEGDIKEKLYFLRIEPSQYKFDIAFHENALTLENWQVETNALVIVNGGYFRKNEKQYFPNGLTIVNSESFGESFGSFAGMLAIDEKSTELRWMEKEPYDPNEELTAALQSFPILVKPGSILGFTKEHEDNIKARRTVIGQDTQGKIIFLVTSKASFTLHQLSLYLTESDLNLDIAFNLDGGPSSGILLANPLEIIPAQTLLPFVIFVHPR